MISAHSTMIGTEKQIAYAQRIIQDIRLNYPHDPLPETPYASFWIENKGATPEQLCKLSCAAVHSPFTKTYPKYTRADVVPLLKSMYNWAVFDTETSGLPPRGKKKVDGPEPEIVEMTILSVENNEELLFHSLFRPYDVEAYFNSEARQMHSYAEEDYLNAPTFKEKWAEIEVIISNFHLVAYNADFDIAMLRRTAQLWGIPAPKIKGTCAMGMFEAFMTTETSDGRTYKLSEACALMGIDQERYGCPHTALADTLALHDLLLKMKAVVEIEG